MKCWGGHSVVGSLNYRGAFSTVYRFLRHSEIDTYAHRISAPATIGKALYFVFHIPPSTCVILIVTDIIVRSLQIQKALFPSDAPILPLNHPAYASIDSCIVTPQILILPQYLFKNILKNIPAFTGMYYLIH